MALLQSHIVSLGFFKADAEQYKREKPYVCLVPLTHAPPGFSQSNVEYHDKDVNVYNIRGTEDQFKIDIHGFQLIKHQPKFDAWQDGQRVVKEYYPHVIDLLKTNLGVKHVHIYDHTTRLGDHIDTPHRNRNVQGAPSISAHVDHTLDSAIRQIKDDFGHDAEKLLSNRIQIINVWHPIVEPIEQHPLTLCDYRTSKLDGHPSDLVYPHFDSENLQVAYSESQKWYFIDRQMIDEAWLIKMADSTGADDPNISEFSPHTSFVVPWARKDCHPRESIEFRAYIFYGDTEPKPVLQQSVARKL